MAFVKYFAALWLAVIFYAVASFFVGGAGLEAYNDLTIEYSKQQENLKKLEDINALLSGEKDALENDTDTIALYARELGYGTGEERFIRIAGRGEAANERYEAGEVYNARESETVPNRTILIISTVIFVMMALCAAVFDIIRCIKNV
jgi:cell division protein FtsB